ncbi:MAG: competence/damage-inducible protein A [Planctomycetota bacterium]
MHRTASIVSIGDELILGQTLDTNSKWLSEALVERGLRIIEHVTVADDIAAMVGVFARLRDSSDIVIATGGLGPTPDDLTRRAAADAVGDQLVEDGAMLAEIRAWYAGRERAMPEANRVQALRPVSATPLSNPNGTAPGLWIRGAMGLSDLFCLPGPPREMRPMFEAHVLPALSLPEGQVVRTRVLRTCGIGESDVADRLGDLLSRERQPLIGTTASLGVVSVRMRFEGEGSGQDAEALLDDSERLVRAELGPYCFGTGDDTLESVLVDLLRERGERLVVVESCTGGLLGSMFTDVPGSSDVFTGGWITYTNAMKAAQVGVNPQALASMGAVSAEVATAMAEGGLIAATHELDDGRPVPGVEHALAITGVAGPGGGSDEKPVGTVWVALASKDAETDVRRFKLRGDRRTIREWAARSAEWMLWMRLSHGAEGRDVPLLREAGAR